MAMSVKLLASSAHTETVWRQHRVDALTPREACEQFNVREFTGRDVPLRDGDVYEVDGLRYRVSASPVLEIV